MNTEAEYKKGIKYAIFAYGAWGLFPIYWRFLKGIPPVEILMHRIFWSFVFYSIFHYFWKSKDPQDLAYPSLNVKGYLLLFIATTFLTLNWLTYVYAVNSNQVVETSLGYFINPLVNVLFGVVFLKETLQPVHKKAFICAAIGVAVLIYERGSLPLIAFFLATSFATYGLIRKNVKISSLRGGQIESFMMILPIAALFYYQNEVYQNGKAISYSYTEFALLVGGGVVTGMPLLWFAESVKRLPYYMMGIFQFIAPSLQFLCGVVLFKEPLSSTKLVGFSFIWIGLGFIIASKIHQIRQNKKLQAAASKL